MKKRKTHQRLSAHEKVAQRIAEIAPDDNGCMIWPYCINSTKSKASNYGRIWDPEAGKSLLVHRVAYEVYHGIELGSDELVMHKYDNPRCFAKDHLILGTQQDNLRDAAKKGRIGKGYKHTTPQERDFIRLLWDDGLSKHEISRRTKRARDTITRIIAA